MRKSSKIMVGTAVGVVAAVGAFLLSGTGRDLRNLWSHGILQAVVDDSPENRKYAASREANLKAIYVALNLYEESEGQYPQSVGWMDAIQNRLHTSDMTDAEAAKKLVRPNLRNPLPGQFGYAMNDAVSGKFKDSIKDKDTILVFESGDLTRNAHGRPHLANNVRAISIDGVLLGK